MRADRALDADALEGPLVSVIVPVKNGERFLPQALEDVTAQTYGKRETIVVDGRSTDASPQIARSFPGVCVIEQRGEGLADAWNVGLDAAAGELIAFIDGDDRWSPQKLAAQVDLLRRAPGVDYVVTMVRLFLEPGCALPPGVSPGLLAGDHVAPIPSALLARRSVFDAIGNFRTDFEFASDTDWFARVKNAQLVGAVIPEALVLKRVHDANLSYSAARDLNSELLRILRQSVARKRV